MRMLHLTCLLCALFLFSFFTAALAQNEAWIARYDGAGSTDDIALAMDIDGSGNIYVAGYSYDNTGNDNVRLVKFSPSGQALWSVEYDGGYGWDDARALVASDDGTVTLAGFTANAADWDVLVIQYAADGTQNWLTKWSGDGFDDGKAIAIDDAGYIYVAAESDGPDLSDDIVILRFTPQGALDWAQRYAGTGGWNDSPTDIAVTADGVATVTGTARDTSFDLITLQYTSDGTLQWVHKYDPLGYSYEIGMAVTVDDNDHAFVVGTELTAAGTNDIVVIHYDTNGSPVWITTFDGNPNTYDDAKAIALSDSGQVAITGCSEISTNNREARTILLDSDGSLLWQALYDGPKLRGNDCGEVVMFAQGAVLVAGTSEGVLTEDDFVSLQYSMQGELNWVGRYNGPTSGDDQITGAKFSATDGTLVVSGVSPAQTVDFAVIKYDLASDDDDLTDDDDAADDDDTIDDDDSIDDDDAVDDDDIAADDDAIDDDDNAADDDDSDDDDDDSVQGGTGNSNDEDDSDGCCGC